MKVINRIIINFPVDVTLPPGFERALDGLVGMLCKAYEEQNPTRVMWPAEHGGVPGMHYETFDATGLYIGVAEREASEKEMER